MDHPSSFQIEQSTTFIVLPSKGVRPEEAYNLYRTGRRAGQVARYIGVQFNDTVDLIVEGLQEWHTQEIKRVIAETRRSLLARPTVRVN